MTRSEIAELRATLVEVESSIADLASQFARINRILLMLLRRESRIQYEYDVSGTTIYFRIRSDDGKLHRAREDFMQLFSFSEVGFDGFRKINCCTISAADGITQFEIKSPSRQTADAKDLISVMWEQSEALFQRLPQRSSAVTAPISRIASSCESARGAALRRPESKRAQGKIKAISGAASDVESPLLAMLESHFRELVAGMQTAKSKAAVDKLMSSTHIAVFFGEDASNPVRTSIRSPAVDQIDTNEGDLPHLG